MKIVILIFKNNIIKNKKDLVKIKLKTAEIEKKFSKEGKRTINLDPGYLSESELVLASFKKGTDYKEKENQDFFLNVIKENL